MFAYSLTVSASQLGDFPKRGTRRRHYSRAMTDGADAPAPAEPAGAAAPAPLQAAAPSAAHEDAFRQIDEPGRRRAAGIYGTVIAAAVLASAGSRFTTSLQVGVAVVATLVVYWLAEQYSILVGAHAQGGRFPRWPEVRSTLAASWPMVTASYLPVLALFLADLFGAKASLAAYVALYVAVALLVYHCYVAARASSFRGWALVAMTLAGAVLGGVMIVLKALIKHV